MIQIYKKVEIENFEVEEIEQPKVQESIESEVDELLGDLNPRYFEEIYSLKEAKIRAESSRVNPASNNCFFGGF
ncbi:MAG: hypothetical protein ACFFE4_07230 [Candidatus Thorarchaeota archaeon]